MGDELGGVKIIGEETRQPVDVNLHSNFRFLGVDQVRATVQEHLQSAVLQHKNFGFDETSVYVKIKQLLTPHGYAQVILDVVVNQLKVVFAEIRHPRLRRDASIQIRGDFGLEFLMPRR